MKLRLNNIRSIEKELKWSLARLNLFTGENGTGKSILGDFLQLCRDNIDFVDFPDRQFPVLHRFPKHQDWTKWCAKGDVSKPVVIERTEKFFGFPVQITLQYAMSEFQTSWERPDSKCAQVAELVVMYDNQELLIWNNQQRRISLHAFALYLWEIFRTRDIPSADDLSCVLSIDYPDAQKFTHNLLREFIHSGPKAIDETGVGTFFSVDFQWIRGKAKNQKSYKKKWDPVIAVIVGLAKRFYLAMFNFLVNTPILNGDKGDRLCETIITHCQEAAQKHFMLDIHSRNVLNEDGSVFSKRLMMDFEGKELPYDEWSDGYRQIYARIHEWTEVMTNFNQKPFYTYFSNEQFVIIKHPERGLTENLLRSWSFMVIEDCINHPELNVIIETHNDEVFKYFMEYLNYAMKLDFDVALIRFARYRFMETSSLRINEKCGWVSPYFVREEHEITKRIYTLDRWCQVGFHLN